LALLRENLLDADHAIDVEPILEAGGRRQDTLHQFADRRFFVFSSRKEKSPKRDRKKRGSTAKTPRTPRQEERREGNKKREKSRRGSRGGSTHLFPSYSLLSLFFSWRSWRLGGSFFPVPLNPSPLRHGNFWGLCPEVESSPKI